MASTVHWLGGSGHVGQRHRRPRPLARDTGPGTCIRSGAASRLSAVSCFEPAYDAGNQPVCDILRREGAERTIIQGQELVSLVRWIINRDPKSQITAFHESVRNYLDKCIARTFPKQCGRRRFKLPGAAELTACDWRQHSRNSGRFPQPNPTHVNVTSQNIHIRDGEPLGSPLGGSLRRTTWSSIQKTPARRPK